MRRPFIDTVDKAHQVVREINHTAELEGEQPVVFTTLVDLGGAARCIEASRRACVLDMFDTFVEPLETEFGMKSNHRVGRFTDVSEEPGVQRPHRGHQLLAWPTTTASRPATWSRPT